LIFICSLSRSGIAKPSCEKGTVLDFEEADRTRCILRSTFLIVTHDSPSRFFFHAQSLIVSMSMGAPPEHLPELCGDPVWNAPGQIPIYEVARVESAGTGMMFIKREVFRALANAHPEWKFRAKSMRGLGIPKREFSFDFFQMKVNPKALNYQPEDFFFCEAASELGFGTWVFPMARTVHTGSFDYVLNLTAGLEFGA
jgi:hypothetical protein